MLMQEFEAWKDKLAKDVFDCYDNQDTFEIFFQEHFAGKSWMEMFAVLAYEIHELQRCVEGLIEDMEYLDGQEDQEIEEENRQGHGCSCERRCSTR